MSDQGGDVSETEISTLTGQWMNTVSSISNQGHSVLCIPINIKTVFSHISKSLHHLGIQINPFTVPAEKVGTVTRGTQKRGSCEICDIICKLCEVPVLTWLTF